MTPKEQYEARKAERDKRREAKAVLDESDTDLELIEVMDRLATSFERIENYVWRAVIYTCNGVSIGTVN